MKELWYLVAFVVGALVIYSMIAAIWMAVKITAILLSVGAVFWILIKVNAYFTKKPPE